MIQTLKTHFTNLVHFKPDQRRPFRIILALAYTVLMTVVLIQSSAHPIVGPAAPPQDNPLWEAFLTAGHLIGFSLLTFIIWWAMATVTTSIRALITAVIFACALGLLTELLQTLVPDRSSSIFDLACDWGMTFVVAYLIRRSL